MSPTAAMQRVMSNAVALAVGGVLAQLAFVTLEAVIARYLGVGAYGTFSSVYAYVLIMVHLLDLGMNWQVLQEGSRDRNTLAANLGTVMAMKVVAFVLAYPLVLAALAWLGPGGELVGAFAVFAFFGLAMMVQDALATLFAALQRMTITAVFQSAVPVAMLGAVLVIVRSHPSLMGTVAACVFATTLVTLLWYLVALRTVRPRPVLSRCWSLLRRSYHYGVSVSLNAVYFRLGVVLLSVLRTPAEVGMFAAAYKLLELGFKVPTLAIRVVAPKLFADQQADPRKFRWEVDLLVRITMSLAALMAAVLFTAGPFIVRLVFGDAFAQSGRLVQVIGVALALKTVALVAQTILSTADEHVYRARADVLALLAGVAIAIPLIRNEGALGAALAVTLADLVWAGLMVARLGRHLPGVGLVALTLPPVVGAAVGIGLVAQVSAGVVAETLFCASLLTGWLVISGYLRPLFRFAAELRRLGT